MPEITPDVLKAWRTMATWQVEHDPDVSVVAFLAFELRRARAEELVLEEFREIDRDLKAPKEA